MVPKRDISLLLLIGFAAAVAIFALVVMVIGGSKLTVGSNAATGEQIYKQCLDEIERDFDTIEEYEDYVPRFIEAAKDCERRYLS